MKTQRTRLRRAHERGHYDDETIHAILDAMPLCHLSFLDSFGTPAILPTMQWREGNHVYWHASSAARSLKAMEGQDIAMAITIMDGYVMARSALHHSINYRSVVIYGKAMKIPNVEKEAKLKGMFDALYPGRWEKLRPIWDIELKQTTVFGMEINEASAKIRAGGVGDDEADLDFPLWSGVVPITYTLGAPIDDEFNTTQTPLGDDIKAIKLG